MTYTFSCVLLIPAAMRSTANALINSYGFGPDNLSVGLKKTSDSSSWFGCHIWCNQAFLNYLQANQASVLLNTMIISAVDGGNAYTNWSGALAANGVTLAP
jgi:hypothetical protein